MRNVRGYGAMTMAYEFKMSNGEMGISGCWADEFLYFFFFFQLTERILRYGFQTNN